MRHLFFKKLLALFLTLTLTFSAMPATVIADSGGEPCCESVCDVCGDPDSEPDDDNTPNGDEPDDDKPDDDKPIDDEPTDGEPTDDEPSSDEPTDDQPGACNENCGDNAPAPTAPPTLPMFGSGFAPAMEAQTTLIIEFDELAEIVKNRFVSPGTDICFLDLPDTLDATGTTAFGVTAVTIQGITWLSEPGSEYNALIPGIYYFTPVLPSGYVLDELVTPPVIAVTIQIAITGFAPLTDYISNQSVPFLASADDLTLPETLTVTAFNGTYTSETIFDGVTWQSVPDYDGETPETYIFTPVFTLPVGYVLAAGVDLPLITVEVQPEIINYIAYFTELDEDTANQAVDFGTALGDLSLPETLEAAVWNWLDGSITKPMDAIWRPEPDYDGETAGTYIFTPVLITEGYVLVDGADLPLITAEVRSAVPVITAFEPLDGDTAEQSVEFDTPFENLILPDSLDAAVFSGITEMASVITDVTWMLTSVPVWECCCDDGNPPRQPPLEDMAYEGFAGTYEFTAVLPDGYGLANGVTMPVIAVEVRPLAFTALSAEEDAFRAAVSAAGSGNVILNANLPTLTEQLNIDRTLTLDLNGHTLTIDLTAATGNVSNGIRLANGISLTIIDSAGGGVLNVTNRATTTGSNGNGAGINTQNGTLIIQSGTINAQGGHRGAGIGGGLSGGAGTIIIQGGTVNAAGGDNWGAGIGGGSNGWGGNITISGGNVTATGGNGGASGIGAGAGNGGDVTVTISGGNVTAIANSGGTASALGRADNNGSGSTINITGLYNFWTNTGVTPPASQTGFGAFINHDSFRYIRLEQVTAVPYLDENGNIQTSDNFTLLTDQTTLTNGWYVAAGDVEIPQRITVSGNNVNLILGDFCDVTINGGIRVAPGNSLTLYEQSTGTNMGKLTAAADSNHAGIGGDGGESAGTIIINGGRITAAGVSQGAGIGGGVTFLAPGSGGNITVNGGNITATGHGHGAGIGGGGSNSNGLAGASGGIITITGGTVNATGGVNGGAGIGGGGTGQADFGGAGGNITITGGDITAVGASSSAVAAIGRGRNATAASDGTISITGTYNYWTNTTAITAPGSQTGTGEFTWNNSYRYIRLERAVLHLDTDGNPKGQPIGGVVIFSADRGTVTLNSGWYLLRGTFTNNGRLTINGAVNLILEDDCDVTINGGIRVEGGNSLTIWGQSTPAEGWTATEPPIAGRLNAYAADAASADLPSHAGIGGNGSNGSNNNGNTAGTVIINGGVVFARGGGNSARSGAGIGGGGADLGFNGGDGGNITINGGYVNAESGTARAGDGTGTGAGIGGGAGGIAATGRGGLGGTITITGGTVIAAAADIPDGSTTDSASGAGIGGGGGASIASAGTINISGGTIVASGGNVNAASGTRKAGAGIGGGGGGRGIPGGGVGAAIHITGNASVTANRGTGANGDGRPIGAGGGNPTTNSGSINMSNGAALTLTLNADTSNPTRNITNATIIAENNNARNFEGVYNAAGRHDVIITGLTASPDGTVKPGDTVTLTATLHTTRTSGFINPAPAAGSGIQFKSGSNSIGGAVTTLTPTGTYTNGFPDYTATATWNPGEGTHNLTAEWTNGGGEDRYAAALGQHGVLNGYIVIKADATVAASIAGWTFGETPNSVTNVTANGTGTTYYNVQYKVQGAADSALTSTIPTNAGNYTAVVTLTAQHEFTGRADVDFTITKAGQTAPGAPTEATASRTVASITINTAAGQEYVMNITGTPPAVNDAGWQAGTGAAMEFGGLTPNTPYYFFTRLTEGPNHNASPASTALTVTTLKAALVGTVTVDGTAAFGNMLTANTTGLTSTPTTDLGTNTYEWRRGVTVAGTSNTYTLTEDDIGQTITVTVTTANTDGSVTSTPTGEVAKRNLSLANIADITSVTYNGSPHTPIPVVTDGSPSIITSGDYTVSWSNNTDAGTAAVTITATAAGNYTGSLSRDFTIAKADPSFTIPTDLTATFGQTLADVALPNSQWTWNSPTTTVGNAGTRTHIAAFTPNNTDNFNTIANVSITIAVGKANPAVPGVGPLNATYGDLLSSVELPNSRFTWNSPATAVGNAGTRTHTATYTPADPDNFNIVTNAEITVNVARAAYAGTTDASRYVHSNTANTGLTLTLPTLPAGAAYAATGTPGGATPALISGTPSISGTTLSFNTSSQPNATAATIIIAVTGATNFNDFNVVVTIITADCDHNFPAAWNTKIPATCLAAGERYRVCVHANCYFEETETIDALGHFTNDTCTSRSCGRVAGGVTCAVSVAGLEHDFASAFMVDVPTTCTAEGSQSRHCQRSGCIATTDTQSVPMAAHTPKADNCTVCAVCSATTGMGLNTAHTPGAAATCAAAQTCTHCSFVINPALNHNWVRNNNGTHSCANGCAVTDLCSPNLPGAVCTRCNYITPSNTLPCGCVNNCKGHDVTPVSHAPTSRPAPQPTPAPAPSGIDSVVFVDGNPITAAEVKIEDDKITVIINQDELNQVIKTATENVTIVIPDIARTGTAEAAFVLQNVDDMAEKELSLTVRTGGIAYNIPMTAIETSAVMAALGAGKPAGIHVTVAITAVVDDETRVLVEAAMEEFGTELVFPPIQFTITAEYNGQTAEVTEFTQYVSRTVEITAEQAGKVTTAIVIEPNGTVRHVPTYVFEKDGKWYVSINSMTNSTYALIFNEVFITDAAGKWYETIVNEMASRMIITDIVDSDGMFYGDRPITRTEFAAVIIRALGLPVNGGSVFTDVPGDAWYAGFMGAAHECDIVSGIGNNVFAPDDNITRQEAMVMLRVATRIAEFVGGTGSINHFSDADDVSGWALDAVRWNVGSGLVSGRGGGLLAPLDIVSRAETATMALNFLRMAGLINDRTPVQETVEVSASIQTPQGTRTAYSRSIN